MTLLRGPKGAIVKKFSQRNLTFEEGGGGKREGGFLK
jgi:hypothetical protein